MDYLYGPAQWFVWHPGRAWLVAAVYSVMLAANAAPRRGKLNGPGWALLASALAWLLFGYNEYLAHLHRWDIRIDLLLTWPALVVLSLGSMAFGLRYWLRGRANG